MPLRPASSFSAVRLPLSIHRRTVSSLTPRNAAASLIRMDDNGGSFTSRCYSIRVYGSNTPVKQHMRISATYYAVSVAFASITKEAAEDHPDHALTSTSIHVLPSAP
jgi:hypothetical protein